jgi:hypothetical protein
VCDIINSGITDEGGILVANALNSNDSVHTLLMGYNNLMDNSAIAFAKALNVNMTLRNL